MRSSPLSRLVSSRRGRRLGFPARSGQSGGVIPSTGDPTLPLVVPSAARVAPTGTTWNVTDDASFATALAGVAYGDRIVIASTAVLTQAHMIPALAGWAAGQWVIVETDQTASLPALAASGRWAGPGNPQVRVNPTSHAALMPELRSQSALVTGTALPALQFAEGSAGWYFRGLRFTWTFSSTETMYGMVRVGESKSSTAYNVEANLPHDVIFQQCIWDAQPGVQYGLAIHAGTVAVVNCHIHTTNPGNGEAKGVWIGNSPGPVLVENNHIQSNGENFFIGGSDSVIPGMIPSDITVRWNWCYKPASWIGTHTMKNPAEQKNGIRVLYEYNVFDGCNGTGQSGQGLTLKTANQDGKMYWCESGHVTVRYNLTRNVASGFELLAEQRNAATPPANYQGAVPMHDILVEHNLVLVDTTGTWTGAYRSLITEKSVIASAAQTPLHWQLRHNTILGPAAIIATVSNTPGIYGWTIKDNIFGYPLYTGLVSACYGFKADSLGEGNASLGAGCPDLVMLANALTSRPSTLYSNYPGNYFPANDTGRVNADGSLPAGSPYLAGGSMQASDGTNLGADVATILAMTAGVDS